MTVRTPIFLIVSCCLFCGITRSATVRSVPASYATIASAIAAAVSGDTVMVEAGTYVETLTISTPLTLIGAGSGTIITGSIKFSANNITCKDVKVQGSDTTGIMGSGISNLSLVNIYVTGHQRRGVSLGSITGITVSNSTFSKNVEGGFRISNSVNVNLTNVIADSNTINFAVAYSGSGVTLNSITGTTVLTDLMTRYNERQGLEINSGCDGISIVGGTFSNNGKTRGTDGGGIAVDASGSGTRITKNISIQGTVTASNNKTAGIWLSAEESNDSIQNITIGSTGTITLNNNGGSGVIVYGSVHNTIITASFTRSIEDAAGVLVLGTDNVGSWSPVGTVINHSSFTGYIPGTGTISSVRPAIALYDRSSKKCTTDVSGTGNTFVGYADAAAIETIVYHKPDDAVLGTVTLTDNNPVPVELTSFTSLVSKQGITLFWSTATEVNNFGFEIERKDLNHRTIGSSDQWNNEPMNQSAISWRVIGFVEGHGNSNTPHRYSFVDASEVRGNFLYRLKQIDRDGSFSYSESIEISRINSTVPGRSNPFNAETNIVFDVPASGRVTILLYDALGRQVRQLFSENIQEGQGGIIHTIRFNAGELSTGMYFCVLHHTNDFVVKKVLLVR